MRRYLPLWDVPVYIERVEACSETEADPDDETFAGSTPDPKDDYLLALAVACSADVIVSGDPHLHGLEAPPVRILTPRGFLEELDE